MSNFFVCPECGSGDVIFRRNEKGFYVECRCGARSAYKPSADLISRAWLGYTECERVYYSINIHDEDGDVIECGLLIYYNNVIYRFFNLSELECFCDQLDSIIEEIKSEQPNSMPPEI